MHENPDQLAFREYAGRKVAARAVDPADINVPQQLAARRITLGK